MAKVYLNAALTIAASRSLDCKDGFLSDRNVAPWVPVCFENVDGPFELAMMPSPLDAGIEGTLRLPGHGPISVRLLALDYLSRMLS
jgi:hypothetical protein